MSAALAQRRDYNILNFQATQQFPKINSKKEQLQVLGFPNLGYDNNKDSRAQSQSIYQRLQTTEKTRERPLDYDDKLQIYRENKAKNLMNCSNSNYNFISYKYNNDYSTQQSLKDENPRVCYKGSAVCHFNEIGRLMNPNYHQHIKQLLTTNPNAYRKKNGLCVNICENQKSYGTKQCFRKFK